jgi:putative NADH-flavin reductase
MRIAVFGAMGATGSMVVEQAIRRGGYEVTAFIRHRWMEVPLPKNLSAVQQIVYGDVLNQKEVEQAIINQDAIISTLGMRESKNNNMKVPVVSEGTKNIITAMKKHNVQRLIVQSAHGAAESAKEILLPARLIIRGLFLKYAFEDKDRMERIVRESGLLWTIVRPTRLTHETEIRNHRVGEHIYLSTSPSVSRADVADFMLNQLNSIEFVHKAPTISY